MSRNDEIERLSRLFSALGNQTRLKILTIITETKRPLHIKAVAKALQMDYAAVYRHIRILSQAGLIQIFDVGRSRVISPAYGEILQQIFILTQRIKSV